MSLTVLQGDCRQVLRTLADGSVQCCVTSPPYFGLRDYGVAEQVGQEETPQAFVDALVGVFREVRRVLADDGTCWVNLGDSYKAAGRTGHGTRTGRKQGTNRASLAGQDNARASCSDLKPKDLLGIPWRVAFALQADGWFLRQDIIWHKPNPMPESVTDRCTKAHEYIFLLSKSASYFYDHEAIKERAVCGANGSEFHTGKTGEHQLGRAQQARTSGNKSHKYTAEYEAGGGEEHRTKAGLLAVADTPWESRNKRSVWTVSSAPYREAHFATYPPDLIKPCILAGSRPGDTILDPFGGSGTTGQVALELGRRAVLIELNPKYVEIINRRTSITPGLGI